MEENTKELYDNMTLKEKIDHFWYYHKKAVILSTIGVIMCLVCLVQCAKRTDYGVFIVYCGPGYIGGDATSLFLEKTEAKLGDALDEDSEISFSKITYVPEKLIEYYIEEGIEFNGASNYDAVNEFNNILSLGTYPIMLITREMYDSINPEDFFVPLTELGISHEGAIDGYGILFSETELGKQIPNVFYEDTVLVFEKFVFMQSVGIKAGENKERYEIQKEAFIRLCE